MASAHELLTATRWRGADMRNIAAAELGGLPPGQTRWEGPDLLLTPAAANALSLALHELATNAVKFGALSVEAGGWTSTGATRADGGLELEWVESDGPLVPTPTRTRFRLDAAGEGDRPRAGRLGADRLPARGRARDPHRLGPRP